MFIKILPESEIPLYTQLIDEIKLGIAKKELLPGEPLPSVRVMAGDLGMNMHTVNKAYQRLKEEGILRIHRQRGVMVSPEMPVLDTMYLQNLEENLTRFIADGIIRKLDKKTLLELSARVFDQIQKKEDV